MRRPSSALSDETHIQAPNKGSGGAFLQLVIQLRVDRTQRGDVDVRKRSNAPAPRSARHVDVVGYYQHRPTGTFRGGGACTGVADAQAASRGPPEPPGGTWVGFGRGLAVRHFVAAYGCRKILSANAVQC